MTDRYDLTIPRETQDGKKFYTKVGVAFPIKSGNGFRLVFNALPMPAGDGTATVLMLEPREDDRGGRQAGGRSQGSRPAPAPMDDDIPF